MCQSTLTLPADIETLADFEEALYELESAEDFLSFFQIDYQPQVVQVNRLHILQSLHDALAGYASLPDDVAHRFNLYRNLLEDAYQRFVHSSAQQEKVLKVFKRQPPGEGFVTLDSIQLAPARNPAAGGC